VPAKFTCEQVQEKYPDPHVAYAVPVDSYCVMGACGMYLHGELESASFPNDDEGAEILEEANPNLTPDEARGFAWDITTKNDDGKFDEAWVLLCEALLS
jgi:hypothetical protein